VEAAAKEMAKEVAVGLEEGASLVARAEKGLEVRNPMSHIWLLLGCAWRWP
jgi:hypothetical protein